MSAEHGQDPAVGWTADESPGWRQRFHYWRATRPFWAGVITAFAGLWLIWSPQIAIGGLALTIGIVTDGWLIGALLIILAIGMWLQPQVRGLAGAMVIVLSLGSFIKINFGGFLIGMLAGLVGGAMAIAWTPDAPPEELEDEEQEQEFEEQEQEFEEPSDHLLPMADYPDDRRGVISNAEPVTEPVGEVAEPPPLAPRPPEPPHGEAAEPPPLAPRSTEMAPSPVRLTPSTPPAEPAPIHPSWPAVDSDRDRSTGDAGRITIALSEAVAIVSILAVVLVLGASSVAVGQDSSPPPSPSPSPTVPPSPTPTPTPTVPPSPSTPPTATPSANPTAKPSPTAEPSPTTAPPKQVRAAAGAPQPAGMTGRLTADSSTMSGLEFGGVVTYQDTPHGTVRALRFTADRNELNDMTLRVTIRGVTTTISDGNNDTTVLAGNVVMDVTRIAGNLGGVPVEFTADSPPPQVVSPMVLTELSADLLLVQADRMDVPSMNQGFG